MMIVYIIGCNKRYLQPPGEFIEPEKLFGVVSTVVSAGGEIAIIAKDVTIRSRTRTLNRKLDIMHNLYQILSDTLNHRHSSKLEWIIIVLIMIEVILGLISKIELF